MHATAIAEFNLGSNAYKSGKSDKAIKHFIKAMDSVFQGTVSGVDLKAIVYNRHMLAASISCALAKCYIKKAENDLSYMEEVNQHLNNAKLYLAQAKKYQCTSKDNDKPKLLKQLKQKNAIVDAIYEISEAKMDLYWNTASAQITQYTDVLDDPAKIKTLVTAKKKTELLDKLKQLQMNIGDELNGALSQAKMLKAPGRIKNILNLLAIVHERIADVFSAAYDDPNLKIDQELLLETMLTNYQLAFEALLSARNDDANEQLLGLYRSVLNVLESHSFLAERKGNINQAIELCNELLKFSKKLALSQFSQEQLADCKQEIVDYTTNTQQRLARYTKLNEQQKFDCNPVTLSFSQSLIAKKARDSNERTKMLSDALPLKKRIKFQ